MKCRERRREEFILRIRRGGRKGNSCPTTTRLRLVVRSLLFRATPTLLHLFPCHVSLPLSLVLSRITALPLLLRTFKNSITMTEFHSSLLKFSLGFLPSKNKWKRCWMVWRSLTRRERCGRKRGGMSWCEWLGRKGRSERGGAERRRGRWGRRACPRWRRIKRRIMIAQLWMATYWTSNLLGKVTLDFQLRRMIINLFPFCLLLLQHTPDQGRRRWLDRMKRVGCVLLRREGRWRGRRRGRDSFR